VSAVTARSTLAAVGSDWVRAFQLALYRAAKAAPTRRFHALFDKVYRSDVLDRAWQDVRRNHGAAGIDRLTLAAVEDYGVARLLGRAGRGAEGAAVSAAAGPAGVHPQAGQHRAASAVDPFGS
jgi:RNA-directed DNA polymerase